MAILKLLSEEVRTGALGAWCGRQQQNARLGLRNWGRVGLRWLQAQSEVRGEWLIRYTSRVGRGAMCKGRLSAGLRRWVAAGQFYSTPAAPYAPWGPPHATRQDSILSAEAAILLSALRFAAIPPSVELLLFSHRRTGRLGRLGVSLPDRTLPRLPTDTEPGLGAHPASLAEGVLGVRGVGQAPPIAPPRCVVAKGLSNQAAAATRALHLDRCSTFRATR